MDNFILKELVNVDMQSELEKIGFDAAYRAKAVDKFQYKTFKIYDLTLPQANILKQTALSFGADCGVHRDVLVSKIDKTDVIIGGSYSQIKKICEKVKQQPFSLKLLAEKILISLEPQKRNTKLVGILNITPDSFSDGGKYYNPQEAIKHYYQLIEDGADIIDVGAESTRPNFAEISSKEQIERLKPFFKNLKEIKVPISIDTRNSEVAMFALDNGATIVNDVSGLEKDTKILDIVAKYNATLVIQHSGNSIESNYKSKDVVEEVFLTLFEKSNFAKEKGVKNIILDPGIGFGKSRVENLELLSRFEEFSSLKYQLMLGLSRKSFLGAQDENNEIKDALTISFSYPLIGKVDYLRVHNVKLHKKLLTSVI